jgi:hypothetical protein
MPSLTDPLPVESGVLHYQDTLLRTPPGPSGQVFAPGTVLAGRFELVRFIARGGMGVVYEAEDRMLRARVAVKVLTRAVPDAEERIRRAMPAGPTRWSIRTLPRSSKQASPKGRSPIG